MTDEYNCHFCGQPVRQQESGIHRLISGWTDSRGGTKSVSVVLTSPPLGLAHKDCITFQQRIRKGPEQDSLFD